jgi:hypothetical protein
VRSRTDAALVLLSSSLLASTAAGEGAASVTMRLDGAECGVVRSIPAGEGARRTLTILTSEPTAPMLSLTSAFIDGKGPKKNAIVLSTDAVVQKTSDAKLVEVRLPSYAGGSTDLAMMFEAPSTSTSPSFRAANDRTKTTGKKLAGFRLSVGDLPTNDATRLDALVLKAKDGAFVPQAFAFDVPSKDAPAFLAWSKKPRMLDTSIEYVGSLGETVFGVKLAACTSASPAKIDGPVTHVTVACARTRAR